MVIITGLRGCAVAFANGLVIRVKYALVSDHVEGEGGGPILLPRFWLGRITRYRGATVRHARRLLACPVLEFPVTGSRFKSGRWLRRCGHINDTKPKTRISERLWPRRTVP